MKKLLILFILLVSFSFSEIKEKNIWFYLNFDGNLNSLKKERVLKISYGVNKNSIKNWVVEKGVKYTEGKSGKAIDLKKGIMLSYYLDTENFPAKEGTLLVWIKPHQNLNNTKGFLFESSWASFEIQLQGGRIGAYYTSDHKKGLWIDFKKFEENWENKWHLIVMGWKDDKRTIYIDGLKVKEATGIPSYGEKKYKSPIFDFGFLRPGGGRTEPVGFIDAAIDDFAILNKMLSEEEIKNLWENKSKSLLEIAGISVLPDFPRKVYIRGENIPIKLKYFKSADKVEIKIKDEDGKIYPYDSFKPAPSYTLDTQDLRPGNLEVIFELINNNRVAGKGTEKITIHQFKRPEFPVGIGGEMNIPESILKYYAKNHISFITSNGPQGFGFRNLLDKTYKYGIALFPNLNIVEIWARSFENLKKEPYFIYSEKKKRYVVNKKMGCYFLQTLVPIGGKPEEGSTSSASPFSDYAFSMMKEKIKEIMEEAGDHPGFQYISFQDEVPLRISRKNKKVYIGDYSYPAIKYFEKITGIKGPVWPPDLPEGSIIPDNHPYLKWVDIVGVPGDFTCPAFDNLYKKLSKEVKKYKSDILTTNYSGGEYGYLDAVGDWRYPYIWTPKLWGGGKGEALLDFEFDLHLARQRVFPKKPRWALLGWWTKDMSKANYDFWVQDYNLDTEIAIAKGVKLLEWFSPGYGKGGYLSTEKGRKAFEKWTDFLYRYGDFLSKFKRKENGNIAVYWSEIDRAPKIRKGGWPARARYDITYTALRIAGTQPYIVTDKTIKKGILKNFDALVLLDLDYSTESIWKEIKKFSSTGKVYYDKKTTLYPPSAIPIDFSYDERAPEKFWPLGGDNYPEVNLKGIKYQVEKLKKVIPENLKNKNIKINGSDYVAYYFLYSGNSKLLFLINYNWKNTEKVNVGLKEKGTIYTFPEGKKLNIETNNEYKNWDVSIPEGGWKIYYITPAPLGRTEVQLSTNNHILEISIQVKNKGRNNLNVPVPLSIEIYNPEGKILPYTRPSSTDSEGKFYQKVILSKIMDKRGTYRVIIKNFITGEKIIRKIKIGI